MLLGFGIIILLSVIMALTGTTGITSLKVQLEKLYAGPYQCTTETIGLKYDLSQLNINLSNQIMEKDAAKYQEAISQLQPQVANRIAILRTNLSKDTDRLAIMDIIEAEYIKLTEIQTQVQTACNEGFWYQAQINFLNTYLPTYEKVSLHADTLDLAMREDAAAFFETAGSVSTGTLIVVGALLLAVVAFALATTMFTTRAIVTPIKKLLNAAQEISNGNLDVAVDYHSKDELGSLAQTFSEMSTNISVIISDIESLLTSLANGDYRVYDNNADKYVGQYGTIIAAIQDLRQRQNETILHISQAAVQVSTSSEQVSGGAQALSQGAITQAASIEELSGTINEISGQIKANATHVQHANELVADTQREINAGNEQMNHMTHAIANISTASKEISKIIKTIDDIAFQTNILALNAAVEAARAGEAGKGFAVVADEVRNLAQKSAEAAKHTTDLIEDSIKAVQIGTKTAELTAKSLEAIVEKSAVLTDTIQQIAIASNEQATSVVQVTQGVDEISSVVQTNSATAQQSAAASEELLGQAQLLKELVSRFHLQLEDEDAEADNGSFVADSALADKGYTDISFSGEAALYSASHKY